MDRPDRTVIVICQEGSASNLAAASLAALGLTNVADVVGGMDAWVAAGLSVSRAPTDERF